MRNERIFKIINELDANLIEEAETINPRHGRAPIYALATAASLFLLISITSYMYHKPNPSLPKLEVNFYENGGMGFSGYQAYSADELVNNNPWTEDCELTHLPVFWNKHPVDGAGRLLSYDWEAMDSALTKVANNLGITDLEIKHSPNAISGPPEHAATDNMTFKMQHPHLTSVFFEKEIEIPQEYKMIYRQETYEKSHALATYILETYPEMISMENPVINISGGDYGTDDAMNWPNYEISFYDNTNDITQNILNYNFNLTIFYTNVKTGNLYIYRVYDSDLSGLIDNYPIISADEAQKLLCQGYYGTNVPEDFPGEEYIAKRELVYRSDIMQSIFIPYYLFYVELPDEYDRNGLNCYGLYYVPAVESRYIENFRDVWNIRYN